MLNVFVILVGSLILKIAQTHPIIFFYDQFKTMLKSSVIQTVLQIHTKVRL